MGIFSEIVDKIFHRDKAQPLTPTNLPPSQRMHSTDLEAILMGLEKSQTQKLNWRTSIVDLMKLLNMDSSPETRQALADELGYTGDKQNSAKMNLWLHGKVMEKVKEEGGKIPGDWVH